MKKKLLLIMIFIVTQAYATQSVYERNCVSCHQELPASLQQMFKKYLLIYSSEKLVKLGIKHYLRHPSNSISVMSELFLDTYGVKEPSRLTDEELDEALDVYWEKFKVFDKLK